MTLPIALVLVLLVVAVLNFAWEWLAIEVFALLLIVGLVVLGILTPQEAYLGFANAAIVMIAGVMILTGGIIHNGAADMIARKIQKYAGGSERRTAALLLAAVNAVSSVINNVAATAMFVPVGEGMARRFKVPRGRYLLAIAFASMTGGMCTLIGTSTNVAVAGAMEPFGLEPLRFFELAPVGILVALAGMLYLLLVAPRVLRTAPEKEAVDAYGIRGFLYEVLVRSEAAIAGRTVAQADLGHALGLNILAIVRGDRRIISPLGSDLILAGDLLLVEGAAGTIPAVVGTRGLDIKLLAGFNPGDLLAEGVRLAEATLSYNSPFIGRSLKELNFRHRFDLSVLAIHRRGEVVVDKVGKIRLRAGDVLLIHGREENFDRLGQEPTMLLLESVVLPQYNPRKALHAAIIFGAAIVAATLGWLDTPTAFLLGGALVMALKCLTAEEAGSYLNIRFLVMLAGMVSLGMAMERSGAAAYLARLIVDAVGPGRPLLLMAAFFVLTVILTQPLSNAAAALLVLPIAVHAAEAAAVVPRAFVITITLAASCSFITPFEPACLLVYATGRYRFGDFVRVGLPLTFLAFLICMATVPVLWPLRP